MFKYTLSESSISLGNPLFALFYAHTQQDWILETGLTMRIGRSYKNSSLPKKGKVVFYYQGVPGGIGNVQDRLDSC